MKKLLALALALALLCAMAPLAIADEPITVTVIGPESATNSSNEGYKLVQDWILENTGVLINQITLDGTNNTEKQNALLTGDTTIDVWWGDWMQYSEYGMIRTINEYLEAIPNTMKTWENFGGLSTVTDSEGNVWGLPRNCNRVFYQSFIREDFLKQLGYTEETYPTTFEEFEKYLYAVKEADPFGNGETIALITRGNMTTMEYHFLGGFTKHGYSNWLDETDGLVKPYYLQEGYYDFLEKMHQWYADGIIHKENYSWDTNTVKQYLASGRVAASAAYSTDLCNQYINLRANVPEAKWWASVNGMTRNGELCETQIKAASGAMLFNAKSSDETIRAYLKVLEFLFSDWGNNYSSQCGPQGIYWDYDVENYGEEAKTLHIVKALDYEAKGYPKYSKDFWYSIGLPMESDCVMYDADGVQNMQNEWIRHQGDTFAAKAPFDININYNTKEMTENVMSYNDIQTKVEEDIMSFFNGQKELTKENWDKFVQELYGIGMQEYCEELTRQYKHAKGLD